MNMSICSEPYDFVVDSAKFAAIELSQLQYVLTQPPDSLQILDLATIVSDSSCNKATLGFKLSAEAISEQLDKVVEVSANGILQWKDNLSTDHIG